MYLMLTRRHAATASLGRARSRGLATRARKSHEGDGNNPRSGAREAPVLWWFYAGPCLCFIGAISAEERGLRGRGNAVDLEGGFWEL